MKKKILILLLIIPFLTIKNIGASSLSDNPIVTWTAQDVYSNRSRYYSNDILVESSAYYFLFETEIQYFNYYGNESEFSKITFYNLDKTKNFSIKLIDIFDYDITFDYLLGGFYKIDLAQLSQDNNQDISYIQISFGYETGTISSGMITYLENFNVFQYNVVLDNLYLNIKEDLAETYNTGLQEGISSVDTESYYNEGYETGTSEGYENGFLEGYLDLYNNVKSLEETRPIMDSALYQGIYDSAFAKGQSIEWDSLEWLKTLIWFTGALFNIKLIDNISLGTIAWITIIFTVIPALVGVVTFTATSGRKK